MPFLKKTAEVARAVFPKGSTCLTLFDTFGSLFSDPDFAALFPDNGLWIRNRWCITVIAENDRIGWFANALKGFHRYPCSTIC
jgi:hypothetical protein